MASIWGPQGTLVTEDVDGVVNPLGEGRLTWTQRSDRQMHV